MGSKVYNNSILTQVPRHKLGVLSSDGAFELAISYLSTMGDKALAVPDERLLCQKIQTHLAKQSARDAEKFNECYSKLKSSVSIKNPYCMFNIP